MSLPCIGFAGVGLIGAGMAGRLMQAGHPLRLVAHRNRAPLEPLLKRGAAEAPDAASLLQDDDILFTCVPNADIVSAIADELALNFAAGQVWIDVTTSRPEASAAIAGRLARRGAIFADVPVTGGPGRGHAAKLLNNLVTQGTMILLADAYRCAAEPGVDAQALYDAMMTGAARSGTLEKAVGPALSGDFDGARYTIDNAAKDLAYAHDLVKSVDETRAQVAQTLAERLRQIVEAGEGKSFVGTMLKPQR